MSALTERARALVSAASSGSPGTWSCEPHGDTVALYFGRSDSRHGFRLMNLDDGDSNFEANIALIAAAPTLLAALCDESYALRAEVAALKRRVPKVCDCGGSLGGCAVSARERARALLALPMVGRVTTHSRDGTIISDSPAGRCREFIDAAPTLLADLCGELDAVARGAALEHGARLDAIRELYEVEAERDALRAEVAALMRRLPVVCETCDGFGWHDAGDHGDDPQCADCHGTGATWVLPDDSSLPAT